MNVKYTPDLHIAQLKMYVDLGLSPDEIADKMGIGRSTFFYWKKEHPEFKQAYTEAKAAFTEVECTKVEKKLLEKCMGFSYEESEVVTDLTKAGKKKSSRVKVTKKQSLPDVAAIKMYLFNKAPDSWSDKRSLDIDLTDHQKQRDKIEQLFEEVKNERNGDDKKLEIEKAGE